jgi:branched-chain amino acid transport system permease protein
MFVAAVVGYPSFRLRGPFFALSTIAFAEVIHLAALNWRGLTEGAAGLIIPFKPSLSNMMFSGKISYVYLSLGLLFLVLAVIAKIDRSRFGYYLRALREDEDGAKALGIDTARMKLWALMISAFFTSLGGTFYAQYFFMIDPYTVFSLDLSIQMALVSIIGSRSGYWIDTDDAACRILASFFRRKIPGITSDHLWNDPDYCGDLSPPGDY